MAFTNIGRSEDLATNPKAGPQNSKQVKLTIIFSIIMVVLGIFWILQSKYLTSKVNDLALVSGTILLLIGSFFLSATLHIVLMRKEINELNKEN